MMPSHAMVLAAGLGLRMRPLTLERPKPLIEVAGRTMLDRVLDHLDAAGIGSVVVNSHYKSEMISAHLAGRPSVALSHEEVLLETGGGVAKALPLLGAEPFVVANSDIVWLDGATPALARLAAAWDGAAMDALLLFHETTAAFGYEGRGDFFLDSLGRPQRRGEREVAPYLFAGVQLLHPRLVRDVPAGPFSLNLLYDRALAARRLFAIVHDGEWYHIGTPDALPEAETLIREREQGAQA